MKFEVYEVVTPLKSERWRWRVIAPNGRIVAASSEGFFSKEGAEENAHLTHSMLGRLLAPKCTKRWWEIWK